MGEKNDELIYCPHCGASYYRIAYDSRTCMYYLPIIKDGVNINPDKNKVMIRYTCMNCGKDFEVTEKYYMGE